MKTLRRRVLALLAALPILLGLLVPAAAMPCAGGEGGVPMSCDVCLVGVLPGTPACASTAQAVPASDPAIGRSLQAESLAWFADLVVRRYGLHPAPDFPPPR